MLVLLGCEESQTVCIAFRKQGHEAYSCDLKPCSGGHPEWHLQMDVFDAIKLKKWDMGIFFPECTYLTISGAGWMYNESKNPEILTGQKRKNAQKKAIKFFKDLYYCDIPQVAIENPRGIMSTVFRKPNQIIQPWMFGHTEQKATCLWLRGLPNLKRTKNVYKEMILLPNKERQKMWWSKKGSEERSKTYPGIAEAMASQWGRKDLKVLLPLIFVK